MEGKFVYVMANIPTDRARLLPGEDGKRIWIEYEVQCDITCEGDAKNPGRIGFKRFIPDRGRTGKGLVQFWSRDGGLRTIDVEDVIHVGGTSMSRTK